MKLNEIIESENTDGQFDRWSEYRRKLTDKIESIVTTGEIRGNVSYEGEKPTLAIWGAGGCNDIDIGRLSAVAKLVLIDCEKDRVKRAIERYGLDKTNAVAADLFFYDIPYESYEHWEKLLSEESDLDVLHRFLSELLLEAVSTDMLVLPKFNYSVVVGIASQLNSRLAALLYIYRDNYSLKEREDILKHIAIMDRAAVGRLCEMVSKTTTGKIIWGWEESIAETGEVLNIEGNKRLCDFPLSDDTLVWPFAEGKSYNMKFSVVTA